MLISAENSRTIEAIVYLIDTDVISEYSKGLRANLGVRAFFSEAIRQSAELYLSSVTIGELRQGVERIRHRGDEAQASQLESWLKSITENFSESILPFDEDCAHVWGKLRVPNPENAIDKQIAATALMYDLMVVTRNTAHYLPTGVRLFNPFTAAVDG